MQQVITSHMLFSASSVWEDYSSLLVVAMPMISSALSVIVALCLFSKLITYSLVGDR